MNNPRRRASFTFKVLYFGGMALVVCGLWLFLSNYVTATAGFYPFDDPGEKHDALPFRSVAGIVLVVVGFILYRLGLSGIKAAVMRSIIAHTGSYGESRNRRSDGLSEDALAEVGGAGNPGGGGPARASRGAGFCPDCYAPHHEVARFCDECGAALKS